MRGRMPTPSPETQSERPYQQGRTGLSPTTVLTVVLCSFALLAGAVLSLTPPWESNDEPDHVQNVETLVAGHWYKITHDGNLESIQAPLYYLVLAGYQKLTRTPAEPPDGVLGPIGDSQQHGNYAHRVPQDGYDQRLVDLLRLPSILFGLLTVALTYLAARRMTRSPWTPVLAAAVVAGVPKFVFLSGVVNNDNLSNVLGAAGLAAALSVVAEPPLTRRRRLVAAAVLGMIAGLLMLTKVTGALLAPGLLIAVLLMAVDRREAAGAVVAFALAMFAVGGWWLIQNQVRYGDPLAAHAANVHQREVLPAVFNIASPLDQIFVQVPVRIFSSFWYDSGWNQFSWRWFWYVPFWLLTALGLAGFALRYRKDSSRTRRGAWVCIAFALGAIASVWSVGIQANTEEARLAFMGLPAIAILVAMGYERLPIPVAYRFVLPMIGLVGTVIAIRESVILPYVFHP